MKLSENWLREWINSPANIHQWAEKLTCLGLEVESITPLGGNLDHLCVGLVQSVTRHPNADRLNVCQVNVGNGDAPLTIVCGGANVRVNLKVAVANIGAILPGNIHIKRSTIRGVESHGMLCSTSELGLSETSNGIMELPDDAPVGMALGEYLGLPDNILDVNISPNRGDCFSVAGLVRELSAAGQWPAISTPIKDVPVTCQDTLPVKLLAPADCPRYTGRIIRGIRRDAVTPLWMQERLRRSGIRSIHPVVDVMNYVMLELGQPLHAFDLATIDREIQVRHSKPGEKVTLLDGQTLTLQHPALVIADAEKILAMAGIMGGADSGVSATTCDIFIESAHFPPHAVRLTLRRLLLASDGAHRFERGVDPELPLSAMQRASELVLTLCGGQAGPVIELTESEYLSKPAQITLRAARIKRLLGITLTTAEIENLLHRLNFHVTATHDGWKVTAPSYRFDIAIEADLIEELARLHGYDNIPTHAMQGALTMQPAPEKQLTLSRIRHFFADHGYQEAINYSFVDPKLMALLNPSVPALPLSNPISADMSVMRTSLWPGLLQAALFNYNRQQTRVRLFEIGVCFYPAVSGDINFSQLKHDELQQLPRLAGIVMGNLSPEQWAASPRHVDFFDLKGELENVLALTKDPNFNFVPATHPALHPGRSAQIFRAGKPLGYIGELHPELQQTLALPLPVYLFELALEELLPATLPAYIAPSKYPSMRRDLAFVIQDHIPFAKIAQNVQSYAGEALQNVQLFDIYQGQGIAAGQKSIAMGLTFQLTSRTLIDEEVDTAVQRVIDGLARDFQAVLRE